jgi:membrane-bound serine protease (ClpP class)
MKRLLFFAVLLSFAVSLQGEILKVEIDGIIDPVSSEFITAAFEEADSSGAEFLLMRLSTPGGLGISMQEIIQEILNSPVPVVCYVSPKGTHAASAGFFILLAADVAAMAPGTNTGAAHPVFPFGIENEVMLEKVKNDSLASLRTIVELRDRNLELAEKGVAESKSYTEKEAVEAGLIDLVANDEKELLEKLDGMTVSRPDGLEVTLKTEGQSVRLYEMTQRQKILSSLANPNIAVILGVIGALGLYFEFTSPGMIVPGVVGGICLILAMLGFSFIPINMAGVLLLLLAIGLFIAEVKIQGFGILGFGGVLAMLLGLLFLVDAPFPELRIGYTMALAITIPFAVIVIFLLRLVLRSHFAHVVTGESGMEGLLGYAATQIGPKGGTAKVEGEIWRAKSSRVIKKGQEIRVVKAVNIDLTVVAIEDE